MQKRPQCRQRPLPGRCEGVYGATCGVNHALVRVTRAAGGTWACCGEIGRSREHLRYQLSAADDDLTAHVTPPAAASHSAVWYPTPRSAGAALPGPPTLDRVLDHPCRRLDKQASVPPRRFDEAAIPLNAQGMRNGASPRTWARVSDAVMVEMREWASRPLPRPLVSRGRLGCCPRNVPICRSNSPRHEGRVRLNASVGSRAPSHSPGLRMRSRPTRVDRGRALAVRRSTPGSR